jgi:hypothetical protein
MPGVREGAVTWTAAIQIRAALDTSALHDPGVMTAVFASALAAVVGLIALAAAWMGRHFKDLP